MWTLLQHVKCIDVRLAIRGEYKQLTNLEKSGAVSCRARRIGVRDRYVDKEVMLVWQKEN